MSESEFLQQLEAFKVTGDYEADWNRLCNLCNKYDSDIEATVFDQHGRIVTYDEAESLAKDELEASGLSSLYVFLGDCNLNDDLFFYNEDGNLEPVTKDTFDEIITEIYYWIDDQDQWEDDEDEDEDDWYDDEDDEDDEDDD